MSEAVIVFVTCGSEEEAAKIARLLVEERLAACANLVSDVRSIYRWEGKICDEKEWFLLIKTERKRLDDLMEKVKSLHSYAVPEILAIPVIHGSKEYLDWIEKMTTAI